MHFQDKKFLKRVIQGKLKWIYLEQQAFVYCFKSVLAEFNLDWDCWVFCSHYIFKKKRMKTKDASWEEKKNNINKNSPWTPCQLWSESRLYKFKWKNTKKKNQMKIFQTMVCLKKKKKKGFIRSTLFCLTR